MMRRNEVLRVDQRGQGNRQGGHHGATPGGKLGGCHMASMRGALGDRGVWEAQEKLESGY